MRERTLRRIIVIGYTLLILVILCWRLAQDDNLYHIKMDAMREEIQELRERVDAKGIVWCE